MLDILGGEGDEIIKRTIPVGYLAKPQDIAECAIYVASARYLTGECININGGLSFK
jgi:NAD(P)-dependent dehydrogenase (short-subunit alcohol dehydrogenase family)